MARVMEVCRWAASDGGIHRRSLVVALIVGTILNLINQGDVLLHGGAFNWTKLTLTFVVPYCVATYGALSYRLAAPCRLENGAAKPVERGSGTG